ncbi:glycosyltransferase involved in cell wall biosynthesis [Erythromicrobium ramosum]|uniref:Glycosyltransferase n=1 Tax=Erythrobacter ramosus TaxID=35811 RepID=A0A6I4UQW9_9SPHN|nr:glycosyltransferase family 4 protein [Erythrobacter ramosus]MBB3777225.1 glycosyltransferase involved in cell wall biosynthesis [Erythrobacter ramosus]MXP39943.1 glycosyltransferase [Erythrobacter ramosus]
MKLLFLTVMPAPYQRELLAAVNKHPDIRAEVRYFTAMSKDRDWHDPSLSSSEAVMPGSTLHRLGASAHWNHSVISEIKASHADLVVVSDYSALTAQLAMRYLAATRRPFMFWGEVPGFSRRGAIGSWLRSRLQDPIHSAAGIAAIGTVAAEAYRGLFPGKPVFNIPYFCDLSRFEGARSARSPNLRGDIVILFSGQLIDRKGVDVLLAAFNAVADRNPKLRLRILGSGPERERYRALVSPHVKDRVDFVGHKEPCELPDEFSQADVFCLPSRHDGWGVVINEALGAGLPIIVSDTVGAGRDLVRDGHNGMVTPVEDISALADALLRIGSDHDVRFKMAANSRELAKSWGLEEGARRWLEAAQSVLAASPAS